MTRLFVLTLLAAAALAGCGGERGEAQGSAPAAAGAPDPVHVHGLGTDPHDGALLIATHNGLFRLGPGEERPQLVGESLHDLMGFTVVGPGHYLASGHPDARSMREHGLAPHLGVVESRDGGATWTPLSLSGEADFHVLRVAGTRVYGFDGLAERLLASDDGGRTWSERRITGVVNDLAVAPGDADHLVAAGELGLLRSRDGGRSWGRLVNAAGLLAWPEDGPLYLADARGSVYAFEDETWEPVGEVGGEPEAFHATGARELVVALHGGAIRESADGGATWRVRFAPAG